MNERINVLNVLIDDMDAKSAMEKVVNYMQTEPVNVVEIVTTEMLMQAGQEPELKAHMEEIDLMIAGNREILEAAGITEHKRLQELETNLFPKMLMNFLHKNHSRVFLLGETKEAVEGFKEHLETHYSGIRIMGGTPVNENISDDLVLNLINGAEADCIMTALPSPGQEKFIARNKALVNVRMWVALGVTVRNIHEVLSGRNRIYSFFSKFVFKKEIKKEKKKKSL
ncbi:MAG: WecB/TagA/CpsF family glycosyltransferase [Lachnospiraceae bacterium]